MTTLAVGAWSTVRTQLSEILESLTPKEWLYPSACQGWRVRDLVAHLGASAHSMVEPLPVPPGAPPLPENRERQHDVLVDRRRDWTVNEVLEEYLTFSTELARVLGGLQVEPTASTPVTLSSLGTYPKHSVANAMCFDYLCHLRYDLVAPGGPLERPLPAAEHDAVYAAVQWMMLGLPQMQGDVLDATVTLPITVRLTGPGESRWTISRPRANGGLIVEERGGGAVEVTSDALSFVGWGTTRSSWRDHCHVEGPQELASGLLDALDIV